MRYKFTWCKSPHLICNGLNILLSCFLVLCRKIHFQAMCQIMFLKWYAFIPSMGLTHCATVLAQGIFWLTYNNIFFWQSGWWQMTSGPSDCGFVWHGAWEFKGEKNLQCKTQHQDAMLSVEHKNDFTGLMMRDPGSCLYNSLNPGIQF